MVVSPRLVEYLRQLRSDRRRLITVVVRAILLGVTTFIAVRVIQPSLILNNSTPTGGDMGAHVWGPAYLRDHLLPWKLNGWSMDWYSGLPVYRFYMVVPAIFIVLLDVVLPYAVAFKIVAVLGIVTLPVSCWLFGRLARFAYPIPELFALAGLVYLLDESYTIYGGNVASTMAGEFSFSISLSFALIAFGLFANGLQTGRHRIKAAIFMALAVLSHGIVAIYVAVGLLVMLVLWLDRQRLRWFIVTAGTGSLLTAFWIVPFLLNHAYMTDMKYKGEPGNGSFTSYWGMFFALPPFWNVFFLTFALIGLVSMFVRRHRAGIWLGFTGILFAVFVYLFNDSLPVIGLLWNPRLLPMVNLCRYLLAAIGIVELVSAVLRLSQLESITSRKLLLDHTEPAEVPEPVTLNDETGEISPPVLVAERLEREQFNARSLTAILTTVVALLVLGFRFQSLPFGSLINEGQGLEYSWGPFETAAGNRGFVDGWARWNFSGYENRQAYGEYYQVIRTMNEIGETRGCGRALWENFGGNDRYGTTMALMLLPHWTDGCIASSEGLFFEAAGTTPYHFLAAGAMSKQSSNPVRELRYVNNNASVGVPYLQALGINYYMAVTPEAIAQADVVAASDGTLRQIAQAGPWRIYEVSGSEVVVPLDALPAVIESRGGDQRERWLELGSSWLQQPAEWPVLPAADGPENWPRATVKIDESRRDGIVGADVRKVDIVTLDGDVESVPVTPATVTEVVVGNETVSFTVDRVGTPVLVRVSYFPNWQVTGADGPFRVAPNMMVVIPTSNDVKLTFQASSVDRFAYLLTLLGFVAVGLLWRSNRREKSQVTADIVVSGAELDADQTIAEDQSGPESPASA